MGKLVEDVAKAMQWTDEEARNFLHAFVADSEDQLMADLEAACEWASKVESEAALIDVLKRLPAIEARWNDGDMTIALSTERVEDE